MHDGQLIGTRSQEFRDLFSRVKVATRLSSKLSEYCLDDQDAIREAFEELIGKPVGESFYLIPPFYADYGLNITVGRAVFIGHEYSIFNGVEQSLKKRAFTGQSVDDTLETFGIQTAKAA